MARGTGLMAPSPWNLQTLLGDDAYAFVSMVILPSSVSLTVATMSIYRWHRCLDLRPLRRRPGGVSGDSFGGFMGSSNLMPM